MKVDILGKKTEEGDGQSKETNSASPESNSNNDYSSNNRGGFQPRGKERGHTGFRGRGSYEPRH